jgi:psp operon transcriptional activator
VRELKNVVERAVYRSDSLLVREIVFNPFASGTTPSASVSAETAKPSGRGRKKPFKETVEELEIRLLKEALEKVRFNQQKAAKALGSRIINCAEWFGNTKRRGFLTDGGFLLKI